jgi:hypothetical protein
MTAAGAPRQVVAEQITAVWDWLHETLGDHVPNVVYNSLSQQAIEAVELVEEAPPAETRPAGPTADQLRLSPHGSAEPAGLRGDHPRSPVPARDG